MNDALAIKGPGIVSLTSASDVTDLLRFALEKGHDATTMEKLVQLHERITDRAAATEFAEALAEFQNDCPVIRKGRTASFPTSSGGKMSYTYANLNDIVRVVRPLLYARGFSFTFDSKMDEKLMVCTCTLRHVNGHSATASFSAPVESNAGMGPQQKASSALSYAKRVSLVEVLGITSVDPDEEGDADPIAPSQAAELERLATDVGADMAKFLTFMHVTELADIKQRDFVKAKTALEQRRRKKGDNK